MTPRRGSSLCRDHFKRWQAGFASHHGRLRLQSAKQLCELLGIHQARSALGCAEITHGDVVVTCALDTGVSLHWLAMGKGVKLGDSAKENTGTIIPRKNLTAGVLQDAGSWVSDLSFIPHTVNKPVLSQVIQDRGSWMRAYPALVMVAGCSVSMINTTFMILPFTGA